MTTAPTERSGAPPPGNPAPNTSTSPPPSRSVASEPNAPQPRSACDSERAAVRGVVEVDLEQLDHRSYRGLPLRVRIPARWATLAELNRLAAVAWLAAGDIEVTGPDPTTVTEAVDFVRDRCDDYRRTAAGEEAGGV